VFKIRQNTVLVNPERKYTIAVKFKEEINCGVKKLVRSP